MNLQNPSTVAQLQRQTRQQDLHAEQAQTLLDVLGAAIAGLPARLAAADRGTDAITRAVHDLVATAAAGLDDSAVLARVDEQLQHLQTAVAAAEQLGTLVAELEATGPVEAYLVTSGSRDPEAMGPGTPGWTRSLHSLAGLTAAGDPRVEALWSRTGDTSGELDGALGHEELGWYLREGRLGSGDDPDLEETVAAIDSVMAESVLTEAIEVYRGDDLRWSGADPGDLTGVEITDLSHLSTTIDPEHARRWSSTVVHLQVPPGIPAVVMADRDPGRPEAEILLGRGLTYRITGEQVTRDDRGRVTGRDVYARALLPGTIEPPEAQPGIRLRGPQALTAATARLADRPRRGVDTDSALTFAIDPGWDPDRAAAAARALRGYRGATWRETHAWIRAQATGDATVPAVISRRRTVDGPIVHEPITDAVGLVDDVLRVAPLAAPVLLWRGTSGTQTLGDQWSQDDLTGVTWVEASYQSTSAARQVAQGFATDPDALLLLHLHVPAGVGAVRLSSWPTRERHTLEAEILLQRGLQLTVTGDRTELRGTRQQFTTRVLDVQVSLPTRGGAPAGQPGRRPGS